MSAVVVLGDVMVDVVARLDGPLAHASDSPASIVFQGGGSAANTAAWLAAAGERPVLVGRVGDDRQGDAAVAELSAAGVDARLARDSEHPTGTCIVLVGPDGERTMIPDAGANDRLDEGDLPDELLAAGGHLHVGGYALLREGSRPAAAAAIARAREAGMTVSVDPSSAALLSPAFVAAAAGAGLLLPNAAEALALTGEREVAAAARRLARRFAEVVVTLGAEGALWTDGADEVRVAAVVHPGGSRPPGPPVTPGRPLPAPGGSRPPGPPVTPGRSLPAPAVVDTTGAGDAFAAGLIAARVAGAGPAEALAAGSRLAARALRCPGGRPLRPAPTRGAGGAASPR